MGRKGAAVTDVTKALKALDRLPFPLNSEAEAEDKTTIREALLAAQAKTEELENHKKQGVVNTELRIDWRTEYLTCLRDRDAQYLKQDARIAELESEIALARRQVRDGVEEQRFMASATEPDESGLVLVQLNGVTVYSYRIGEEEVALRSQLAAVQVDLDAEKAAHGMTTDAMKRQAVRHDELIDIEIRRNNKSEDTLRSQLAAWEALREDVMTCAVFANDYGPNAGDLLTFLHSTKGGGAS